MQEPCRGAVLGIQDIEIGILVVDNEGRYMKLARKCDKCQWLASISKAHLEELTTMTNLWSFVVWGIDFIGQLLKGRGSVQYAMVAIDYFTKWLEVGALTSITPAKITEFVYKNCNPKIRLPKRGVN